MLRPRPTKLMKLKHPNLLKVTQGLAETKDYLAFATEPVFASLANVLGRVQNIEVLPPMLKAYELLPIEVTMGLISIGKALEFVHAAGMVHANVVPEGVVLTAGYEWRLAGFSFALTGVDAPSFEYMDRPIDNARVLALQPDLSSLAPECVLHGQIDGKSDMFALAHLAFTANSGGAPLHACRGSRTEYQHAAEVISRLSPLSPELGNVPAEMRELLKLLLNTHGGVRPAATDFLRSPCFDTLEVQCLRYLASLPEKTQANKAQFMKGLPQVLEKLPKRVTMKLVVPPLLGELKEPIIVPFVLPNVLAIAETCSIAEFEAAILPALEPVFAMREVRVCAGRVRLCCPAPTPRPRSPFRWCKSSSTRWTWCSHASPRRRRLPTSFQCCSAPWIPPILRWHSWPSASSRASARTLSTRWSRGRSFLESSSSRWRIRRTPNCRSMLSCASASSCRSWTSGSCRRGCCRLLKRCSLASRAF